MCGRYIQALNVITHFATTEPHDNTYTVKNRTTRVAVRPKGGVLITK